MSTPIRLIVGLGNPGVQYETTRHNAGFWVLDHLAEGHHVKFSLESGFLGYCAKIRHEGETIYLLKPTTFMNKSGLSVRALSHFYKIPISQVLVAHDELDLPPGEAKFKRGGGHAGHNGLRDIQAQMGSPDFLRLRLGIGHPRSLGMAQPVHDYVLSSPRQLDMEAINEMIFRAYHAIASVLSGDMDKANRTLRASAHTGGKQ